jgi:hypothetical protein
VKSPSKPILKMERSLSCSSMLQSPNPFFISGTGHIVAEDCAAFYKQHV